MQIGIVSDIHGDMEGLLNAWSIFAREQVDGVICAGDVAERGPSVDAAIAALRRIGAVCVRGNHDATTINAQTRRRALGNTDKLRAYGMIVTDESLQWLKELKSAVRLEIEGVRIVVAHGVPWSDVIGIYPDSHRRLYGQVYSRVAEDADVLVLGHTHAPMQVRIGKLTILNPGSVYGVTMRDSATCAILELPSRRYRVFDLESGEPVNHAVVEIDTQPAE